MKKTSNKKSGSKITRANAHSYLSSVLRDSLHFKREADLLRQKFELREYKVEPEGMDDMERARWLDKKLSTDLTEDVDFIALCKHFHIPEALWSGVNEVINRNDPNYFLRSEIKFTISGDGKPSKPPELIVPHVLMAQKKKKDTSFLRSARTSL